MGRQGERARRRRARMQGQAQGRNPGPSAELAPGSQTAQPPEKPTPSTPVVYWLIFGLALAALLLVAIMVVRSHNPPEPGATPGSAQSNAARIDGIPCTEETLTYHVHAHLTILDAGKNIPVPANIGINYNHACLYWLHTHDDSGVIHVEAPHRVFLPLRDFFNIWNQPLSRQRVASAKVRPGQHMQIWLNGKTFHGDPRHIILRAHADMTFEVGPPFSKPSPYNFDGL